VIQNQFTDRRDTTNEESPMFARWRRGVLVYGEAFVVFAVAGNVMLRDWQLLAVTVPAITIPWVVVAATRSPVGPLTLTGVAVRVALALLLSTAILLAVGGGPVHFALATVGAAAGAGLIVMMRYVDLLVRRMMA
jgi:hypothetical protein